MCVLHVVVLDWRIVSNYRLVSSTDVLGRRVVGVSWTLHPSDDGVYWDIGVAYYKLER